MFRCKDFMRAIILAAGRGLRLQQPEDQQLPKCLLQFGGMSLLERHLRLLRSAGVEEVVLALGFRHELVEAELERLRLAAAAARSCSTRVSSWAACSPCTPRPRP